MFLCGSLLAQPAGQIAHAEWDNAVASGRLRPSRNSSDLARIDRIGQRIVAASRRAVKWDFHLVDLQEPNAVTVGEGVIFATEGLMALGLDDDELAGVLGHEVAHGTEQHIERSVRRQQDSADITREAARLQAELNAAQTALSRAQDPGERDVAEEKLERLRWRYDNRMSELRKKADYIKGQRTYAKEFSQEQEFEADTIGIRYAVAAGYKADGQLRALQKLGAAVTQMTGKAYSGESLSHPSIERRIAVLRRVMQTL